MSGWNTNERYLCKFWEEFLYTCTGLCHNFSWVSLVFVFSWKGYFWLYNMYMYQVKWTCSYNNLLWRTGLWWTGLWYNLASFILRCFCESYDMKQHSTKILREIVNGIGSFIQSQFLTQPVHAPSQSGKSIWCYRYIHLNLIYCQRNMDFNIYTYTHTTHVHVHVCKFDSERIKYVVIKWKLHI